MASFLPSFDPTESTNVIVTETDNGSIGSANKENTNKFHRHQHHQSSSSFSSSQGQEMNLIPQKQQQRKDDVTTASASSDTRRFTLLDDIVERCTSPLVVYHSDGFESDTTCSIISDGVPHSQEQVHVPTLYNGINNNSSVQQQQQQQNIPNPYANIKLNNTRHPKTLPPTSLQQQQQQQQQQYLLSRGATMPLHPNRNSVNNAQQQQQRRQHKRQHQQPHLQQQNYPGATQYVQQQQQQQQQPPPTFSMTTPNNSSLATTANNNVVTLQHRTTKPSLPTQGGRIPPPMNGIYNSYYYHQNNSNTNNNNNMNNNATSQLQQQPPLQASYIHNTATTNVTYNSSSHHQKDRNINAIPSSAENFYSEQHNNNGQEEGGEGEEFTNKNKNRRRATFNIKRNWLCYAVIFLLFTLALVSIGIWRLVVYYHKQRSPKGTTPFYDDNNNDIMDITFMPYPTPKPKTTPSPSSVSPEDVAAAIIAALATEAPTSFPTMEVTEVPTSSVVATTTTPTSKPTEWNMSSFDDLISTTSLPNISLDLNIVRREDTSSSTNNNDNVYLNDDAVDKWLMITQDFIYKELQLQLGDETNSVNYNEGYYTVRAIHIVLLDQSTQIIDDNIDSLRLKFIAQLVELRYDSNNGTPTSKEDHDTDLLLRRSVEGAFKSIEDQKRYISELRARNELSDTIFNPMTTESVTMNLAIRDSSLSSTSSTNNNDNTISSTNNNDDTTNYNVQTLLPTDIPTSTVTKTITSITTTIPTSTPSSTPVINTTTKPSAARNNNNGVISFQIFDSEGTITTP